MKKLCFTTKEEAYKALELVLQTKVDIIKTKSSYELTPKEIFDYLLNKKWKSIETISLSILVSDVLNYSDESLISYYKIKRFIKGSVK